MISSIPQSLQHPVVASDIHAAREMGLDTWLDNFFWPVSDRAFFDLLDAMWEAFEVLYGDMEKTGKDLVLSDINFLDFLAQHLHARAVKEYCIRNGASLIIGAFSGNYYEPDWAEASREYEWAVSTSETWKFQARRALKRLKFNGHLSPFGNFMGFLGGAGVWSLGSFSLLKADFVKKRGLYCDHPYVQTLLPSKITPGRFTMKEALDSGIRVFLDSVSDYCREALGFQFDPVPAGKCWLKRLETLHGIYSSIGERKKVPRALFLSEAAKPLHKIIAMALRERGTRVTGFHHGNDMGNIRDRASSYRQYNHCDEFVCPTLKSADAHAKEHASNPFSRFNRVEFVSAATSFYEEIWENSRKDPLPTEIRSVMIMGYPMNQTRYQYVGACFSLIRLDMELRVVRMLKEEGYRVIYKMHPERQKEVQRVFEGLADSILTDPFERVYQEADAVFFGYIHSTTFGFSLCTNRPVILLDLPTENWNREAYEGISRRCRMIPARLDERNRIQFDRDRLLEELARKPEMPDYSYVRTFMFPESAGGPQR